ncbi:hypothetical protein PQR71_31805 [Paraburkholderia fungorum]|uniref:hypothetical protein n=1 Tax=Paraburkholderia fungorum TaxID=134537 RepID=UPI0038BBDC0E
MDFLKHLAAEQKSIARGERGIFILMAVASLLTFVMLGMALYDAGPGLWHRILVSWG